jgi:hypothetical protein
MLCFCTWKYVFLQQKWYNKRVKMSNAKVVPPKSKAIT